MALRWDMSCAILTAGSSVSSIESGLCPIKWPAEPLPRTLTEAPCGMAIPVAQDSRGRPWAPGLPPGLPERGSDGSERQPNARISPGWCKPQIYVLNAQPPPHPTTYLLQAVAQLLQLPEGGCLAQPARLPSALPLTCHFALSMSVQRIQTQRVPP